MTHLHPPLLITDLHIVLSMLIQYSLDLKNVISQYNFVHEIKTIPFIESFWPKKSIL